MMIVILRPVLAVMISLKRSYILLGLCWHPETDTIVFDFCSFVEGAIKLEPTKRNILKVVSTLFDPLGLLCPIINQMNVIFQKLCVDERDWDDSAPHPIIDQWNQFLHELFELERIVVPRFIDYSVHENVISIELHGFCDSLEAAYSSLAYLRVETENTVRVRLLCAKERVALLKKLTLQHLELLSCLVLSQLINPTQVAIESEIKLNNVTCWSDSEISLFWITNTNKRRKQWVENRSKRIRKNVPSVPWRHVPRKINPLDIPMRKVSPKDLQNNVV